LGLRRAREAFATPDRGLRKAGTHWGGATELALGVRRRRITEPLLQRRHYEALDLDIAVSALNDERGGVRFIRVIRDCGETFDLGGIDHGLAVVHHCHRAADQADVVRLPLARGLAGVDLRRDAAVERAGAVRVGLLAVVFENLNLVATTQADAAVGTLHDAE